MLETEQLDWIHLRLRLFQMGLGHRRLVVAGLQLIIGGDQHDFI